MPRISDSIYDTCVSFLFAVQATLGKYVSVLFFLKCFYHRNTRIALGKMFRTLCVYDAGQNIWLIFLEITQIGCFVRPLKKHSNDISSK